LYIITLLVFFFFKSLLLILQIIQLLGIINTSGNATNNAFDNASNNITNNTTDNADNAKARLITYIYIITTFAYYFKRL
jgi:hypothetical protein